MKQIFVFVVLMGFALVERQATTPMLLASNPMFYVNGTNEKTVGKCCGGPVCFPGEPCGVR